MVPNCRKRVRRFQQCTDRGHHGGAGAAPQQAAALGHERALRYEPAYLAGFRAQRYQIELAAGFEKAKAVMANEIGRSVRRDIGGDEQRVMSISTTYSDIYFLHLLLPVWIGAYQFQNKVYHVVVNARTGDVEGERPYSAVQDRSAGARHSRGSDMADCFVAGRSNCESDISA